LYGNQTKWVLPLIQRESILYKPKRPQNGCEYSPQHPEKKVQRGADIGEEGSEKYYSLSKHTLISIAHEPFIDSLISFLQQQQQTYPQQGSSTISCVVFSH